MKSSSRVMSLARKATLLFLGYALYGLGIVLTINARQGLSPWDVFHQGLSLRLDITMGAASQIVGAAIVILDIFLGERIGWGTVGNVIFIGVFIDFFMISHPLPEFEHMAAAYAEMALGIIVIALATFVYLSAQMGAGPRDGMMIALTKRLPLPVGLIRNLIEISVLTAGYFLGGTVGLGTLVMAIGLGRVMQIIFRWFKFDVRQVRHRYVNDDLALLINAIRNHKSQ